MFRQFLLDWKLYRKSFLMMLAVQLGVFLFGFVMTCVIMNVDDDPGSWFCLGSLLSLFMLVVVALFFYSFSYAQELQLALSMGRTRRSFLGAYTLRLVFQLLAGYVLVLLAHQVELRLYPALFPGFENDFYFFFLTDWRYVLPVLMGLPVLSLFIGALYGRFGKSGLWFFYFLWMFCCFVLPRMADAEVTDTGILDRTAYWTLHMILAVPATVWIGFGAVLVVGMLAAIYRFTMMQMVK